MAEIFVPADINPKHLVAPASKSYAQRAIYCATMCVADTRIKRIGGSDDVKNVLDVCKQLGALVDEEGDDVIIHGSKFPETGTFNVGESGLGIRLLGCILACKGGDFTLLGEGSLKRRTMMDFKPILKQLGVRFYSNQGNLPLRIDGYAHGGFIEISGGKSSQYLSGLLMGLPNLKESSTVEIANVKSRPYIDITIEVLNKFGIKIDRYKYESFRVQGGQTFSSPGEITVEGDYSGMGNFVVLGTIKDGCTIYGLKEKTTQGDAKILDIITKAGGSYQWQGDDLIINAAEVNSFDYDLSDCPDLFPPIIVLAAAATGVSTFIGANRLINKESNRAEVLEREFSKLGLDIEIDGNRIVVNGTGSLKGGTIHSNNDHRIAMAGGIAAALSKEGVTVECSEAVNKSFPSYWEQLAPSTPPQQASKSK